MCLGALGRVGGGGGGGDEFTVVHFPSERWGNKNHKDVGFYEFILEHAFFLISNKTSLIKKRHPSTQRVYKGEQIKNENYKSQVNP